MKAGYQIGLSSDQAEKLIDFSHKFSAECDRQARFAKLLRLYCDTLALDALAEIVPGRGRKATFQTRRDLLRDMQQIYGLEVLKELFDQLMTRGVIDNAIAEAIRRDIELLKH